MKKLRNIIAILVGCIVIGFIGFIYLSNPLVYYGNSTYEEPSGYKDIVFEIKNEGISAVLIKEVLVNNQPGDEIIELGISHDTFQIVQSETENEQIKFYPLGEMEIITTIPNDQAFKLLREKKMTPFHHGIRVKNYHEPIKTLTIKYKYFGFLVTKELNVCLVC